MALVAYSDSESSDNESPAPPKSSSTTTAKAPITGATFRKVEPRKIKVDLAAPKPDPQEAENDRHVKRARTDGAFGGFNSLLPAPKRTAAQNVPAKGVNLKTSSEAAFSRQPVFSANSEQEYAASTDGANGEADTIPVDKPAEPKLVGKATRFMPLSVQAGKKKQKKKGSLGEATNVPAKRVNGGPAKTEAGTTITQEEPAAIQPRPKASLFSLPATELTEADVGPSTNSYEAITTGPPPSEDSDFDAFPSAPVNNLSAPNELQTLTKDLDLTPAQRRQIFGRNAKVGPVNIAHFNMDAEYASNEVLRQSGESIEHKAVKSIAPGKHSLQQLVNNAKSQQENLENKWDEGRRERSEGGAKYGWGK